MARLRILTVSLLVLLCLFSRTGQAQDYSVKQDASGGILNMRAGPGTGHALVRSIPAGSGGLTIGECREPDDGTSRYKWCRASWSGYAGWISSCCIELKSKLTSLSPAGATKETVRQEDMRRHGVAWNVVGPVSRLPVECPYQGEGWTISFSREFYQMYVGRGFSLKALCLALASENVRFDPETGAPLKCYRLADWEDGGCFPFYISDCFKSAQVISGNGTAEQQWRPTGCTLRFDPKTGRKVQRESDVTLFTGGGAGDVPDENSPTRTSIDDARLGRFMSGK